jgi:oligoendopeptidase F
MVLALYKLYRESGDTFVPRYRELLEAGGSESPEVVLAGFGFDIRRPDFWQDGLNVLRDLIDEAQTLAGPFLR